MTQSLEAHRATGANFQSSYNLSKLAEANAHLRTFDAALVLAQQTIDDVERTGERWWEAEAWRLRGNPARGLSREPQRRRGLLRAGTGMRPASGGALVGGAPSKPRRASEWQPEVWPSCTGKS
jgi:hypothetical protein